MELLPCFFPTNIRISYTHRGTTRRTTGGPTTPSEVPEMSALQLTGSLARYTIRNTAFVITDGLVMFTRIVTGTPRLPR